MPILYCRRGKDGIGTIVAFSIADAALKLVIQWAWDEDFWAWVKQEYVYLYVFMIKIMQVLNYSEFRRHMKAKLDQVNNDHDVMVINRGEGRNVVVLSLDEYNALTETAYLVSTTANRQRLHEALDRFERGEFDTHTLPE